MCEKKDTIAAISTPVGEGGIAIIRMSGEKPLDVIKDIFVFANPKRSEFEDRYFYLGKIYDGDSPLDEVMAVYMRAPNTYTGEDLVEIHCHGGLINTSRILTLLFKKGVRSAHPGEFTKRAFLNGKLDLSQAEAIIDIITAKSDVALNSALGQMHGILADKVRNISVKIENVLANLEAGIDFPEEDLEILSSEAATVIIDSCIEDIENLIKEADSGRLVRDGVNTVIIGRPNVGKSSLLNALLKEEKAIVTNIPGTTRDVVEDYMQIRGVPFRIVDTAGFRQTEDIIEKKGIEKTEQKILEADIVLIVVDAAESLTSDDIALFEKIEDINKKALIIINKVDMNRIYVTKDTLLEKLPKSQIVEISALKMHGLDELEEKIIEIVFKDKITPKHDFIVTKLRHKDALLNAKNHLIQVKTSIANGDPEELFSIDLKNAWDALGEITGDAVDEDIIDKIFSEFCLGK